MNRGKVHLDNIKQFACINREKQWPEARALRYIEIQVLTEIWKCFVIGLRFKPLVSADVRWRELRDEPKEPLRGRLPGVLHLSELSLHLSLGGIVG